MSWFLLDKQTDRYARVQHRIEAGRCDAAIGGCERKALRPWPFLLGRLRGSFETAYAWLSDRQMVFLVEEVKRDS